MPEGDTIYRTAANLRRALEGQKITGGSTRLRGRTVAQIESRGKHLLIWFAPGDLALHSHMMMSGSWHLYRPGERWRRSKSAARAVLETGEWVAVCFSAPVCELLTRAQVARHGALRALGPDALDEDTDLAEARRRLDLHGNRAVGEALLDQRILAGVGNVYRCEALFACGVHPWTRVDDLPTRVRDDLLRTAERLLKANVGSARRRTNPHSPERMQVHGRGGRPCVRCGETIRVDRRGGDERITYWCPRCQQAPPRARGRL